MATLDSLQFEMERRVIIFTWQTTMPDDTSLGFNADPNTIITPSTPGEELIYNCPVSTRYAELDASKNVFQEWFKQAKPSVWEKMGSGSDSSIGDLITRIDAIDASLVIIDSSIGDLYFITTIQDVSIGDLYNITTIHDVSIGNLYEIAGILDVSVGDLYNITNIHDVSIGDLYDIAAILDSSIGDLYNITNIQDVSIGDLYDITDSLEASLGNYVLKTGDTMTGDLVVTGVDITNDLSIGGGASIIGNVDIGGDLRVDGSTIFVHTTELDISTNFIKLNTGLTGAPPSWLQSGIVVERGDEDPYIFIFDETDDTFRIGISSPVDASGVYPDSSTQAVATREDDPINTAIAIWNSTFDRFDTSEGLKFDNDGLYVDGSVKISSLAGSGQRFVVVNPDGTLDTSILNINIPDVSLDNIGTGDVSVYYGLDAGVHKFREIKSLSSQLLLDISNNVITIDASIDAPPVGSGIDGGVWITNITPQSTGNVGDKVYSSDGNVLDSCLTDTSALVVHVLALPGHTNYKPIITIDSNPVTISADSDKPLWEGTYNISYNFADASITVLHEDGASWSTVVDADTPAVIQSAEFTGGYPGSQTELKAGDTFDVSIVTDVSISSVIVDNFGAATGGTYSVTPGTNVGFTITIADRGDVSTAYGLSLRVVKPTGSTSATYLTTSQGSVDGKDTVFLNNLYPTVTFGTITYPGSQLAIKSGDDASVVNTVSDFDTITYSSPNGELSISGSTTTYESPKRVVYSSGTYNITTDNLRIVANRAANNATTTTNEGVWIANTPATLSVSNPASRLRSGGNDGTVAQNHTITINSGGQRLLAAPTLAKDTGGTWLGGGFTFSTAATSFTRVLEVDDDMSKGTYNWGAISGTNLAGIETTDNSGTATYVLGGFVSRDVSVAAFGTTATINVEISDYDNKIASTLDWSVKPLTVKRALGTTTGNANEWSASAEFTNPTTIYLLDQSATSSSSQASTVTIQESI